MSGDEVKKEDAVNGKSEKQLEVLMWGYFPGVMAQRSPLNSPTSVRLPETEAAGDSWKDVCAGGCGFGMALFDFDKEDELLGLEKGWDEVDKSGEGFKSARNEF
ncbi:Regulator of chromosome condensation family protein [Perilla frutescens var. hirtella]|uniref:Regulator of chromosome condensation family protein n=1 Tax=Perilla frutescens var. hirtella TaxID=608512 RepID=A0AAD4IUP5_PERFH|nr:Regulator of chromosome condensation family protein [Perilla frutescens var. hirtella]